MIVNAIAEKDHQLKGQNQGKDCSISWNLDFQFTAKNLIFGNVGWPVCFGFVELD